MGRGWTPVGRASMLALSAALVTAACTRPVEDAVVKDAAIVARAPAAATPVTATTVAGTTVPGTNRTVAGRAADAIVTPPPRVASLVMQSPPVPASVATSLPAPLPPPSTPARTVTMAFTGDILPHSPLWGRAAETARAAGGTGFDFDPMLAPLAPVVGAADLAVCHLETPIAPVGEPLSTMPFYGVPAEVVDAIVVAGYDRCSTASNHSLDRGAAGIDRTVEVLGAAGLGQSGMARTPGEIEPSVFEVGGVPIAHLSYTYGYNGLSPAPGEEWRSALIDPIRIVDDARAARALGAAAVIVSLHWGAEGEHEPTQYQRDVAAWLTASDAVDLIVGHHAHVVQPIEEVNGVWVVFGLGNVLSNLPTSANWPAASQDAIVVTTSMTVTADGTVTFEQPVAHPTWVDKDAGWIVRLVDAELSRPDLSRAQRARLEGSLARTAAVVGGFLAGSNGPGASS